MLPISPILSNDEHAAVNEVGDDIMNIEVQDIPQAMEEQVQSTCSSAVSIACNTSTSGTPDPAFWPEYIDSTCAACYVTSGPYQHKTTDFPLGRHNRRFTTQHFSRTLSNKERSRRYWLMYSDERDSVYCFAYKLFASGIGSLATSGFSDWKNLSACLKNHEASEDCIVKWKELEKRLSHAATISQFQLDQLLAEKERWRAVLECLIAITLSLATRNLPFRGHREHLYEKGNGNFLQEIELIAKFDPILRDHIKCAQAQPGHVHYMSKTIQNELIQILADNVKSVIVQEIQAAKYFSVMLDCTPDISHMEQMSVVLRIVKPSQNTAEPVVIVEHFLGFLDVSPSTTGEALQQKFIEFLEDLKLTFKDCRGQSYDNGANMKGKYKGVQARLLKVNPKALFIPCSAHTLNLVVADGAKASVTAVSYFGLLQRLYTFFSASTKRWDILKKHVPLVPKMWSDTRWEAVLKQ